MEKHQHHHQPMLSLSSLAENGEAEHARMPYRPPRACDDLSNGVLSTAARSGLFSPFSSTNSLDGVFDPHPAVASALDALRKSIVLYRGQPVGTVAASDHAAIVVLLLLQELAAVNFNIFVLFVLSKYQSRLPPKKKKMRRWIESSELRNAEEAAANRRRRRCSTGDWSAAHGTGQSSRCQKASVTVGASPRPTKIKNKFLSHQNSNQSSCATISTVLNCYSTHIN